VKIAGIVAVGACIIVLISLLMAFPFMWIWNYAVVSAVTVVKPIGYWVAFWLMMFCGTFIAGTQSNVKSS
jgi:hypothetical protein